MTYHGMPTSSSRPEQAPPTSLSGFVQRVLGAFGDGRGFRFLVEARRQHYLVILHALLERRRAHEVEVYHDELRDEVSEAVASLCGERYDPGQFRADIEQLSSWGNITQRLEPTRIRSLADRTRSKLIVRLEPDTVALLEFLETQTDPVPLGARDQGANLLLDVQSALKEAASLLGSARELLAVASGTESGRPIPAPGNETRFNERIVRAAYLIHEADAKADRAAGELVRFGDALARFVTEPFRVRDLAALGAWLERYIDRYLAVLDDRSRAARYALSRLERPDLTALLLESERLERDRLSEVAEILSRPLRLRPASAVIASLRAFFDPAAGLAEQCRRLNRRTREAIRRIQRHVEAVRLRNIRMEMIRSRLSELFKTRAKTTRDEEAFRFIGELIAPVGASMDSRGGTPTSRSLPPRPARRYESSRPAYRGSALTEKSDRPGETRELERLKLEKLSSFMEKRVLKGRAEAYVSEADLDGIEDGASLVRAIAMYLLRDGRARKHLRYTLARARGDTRARIEAPDHELDLPETLVGRRRL